MGVISSDIETLHISPQSIVHETALRKRRRYWRDGWLLFCLLLACTGAGWFSFQYFLVPQTQTYMPNWSNAQWIQARDTMDATAYFRTTLSFSAVPDNAFITITANQVFYVYANGFYIGNNTDDFVRGNTPETYIFDIDSVLKQGANSIGVRVVNVDNKIPQIRALIGTTWGSTTEYNGSGPSWQATGQPGLAHPRNMLNCTNGTAGMNANQLAYCRYQNMINGLSSATIAPGTVPDIANTYVWTTPGFDAGLWPGAQVLQPQPASPQMHVNPSIYEQPLPAHWISNPNGNEGYFVRTVTIPAGFNDAIIRLVATGKADVFINNHLYMKWDGQVTVPENIAAYLEDHEEEAPYRNGLLMGVYDVTPYLHAGMNTIAVHVQSPGVSTAKVGLDTLKSAMSLDMIVDANGKSSDPAVDDKSWHASSTPVTNWTAANSTANSWPGAYPVGRPGASRSYYLPDNTTSHNVQEIPPMLIVETLLLSTIAIVLSWLLLSLFVLRRFYANRCEALEIGSTAFLPALAVELLLATLAREPLLPQPFPYTSFWGLVLSGIVLVSMIVLWWYARRRANINRNPEKVFGYDQIRKENTQKAGKIARLKVVQTSAGLWRKIPARARIWLKENWGLLPLVALAIPLVWYNLGYEPYWQDELSSYYAARNIMAQGFPAFPSGFIYPKGELFSYLLAVVMMIFGTTSPIVTRSISATWYILSLPMLYVAGSKLFNRRVAWLATAMLTFSPYAMIWARQIRMYEQAQFMVIVVLLTFYYAISRPDNKRLVYLAITTLVLAYFSHEENFIIIPAILFSVLWWTRRGKYGIPAILRKAHWWKAALVSSCIVSIQILTVLWSHPPTFATDQSRRPQIQPSFDNITYYFGLLFKVQVLKDGVAPWLLTQPILIVNALLALLGCILALRQKDWRPRYCTLLFLISLCTLVFIFTMQADRYFYPILPVFYLLGSYAVWKILQGIWRFVRPLMSLLHPQTRQPALSFPIRAILIGCAALLSASILLFPMLPISNYNLFVSRMLGLQYRHHFADYDQLGAYMQSHLQKGDTIITVSPAISITYYVGYVNYYFSVDRALFLIQNNEQIVETTSGAHPLLDEADFQNVLATHQRIWLITDNGNYQGGVTKNNRFTFPPSDFHMVYEGYGSAIYFRDSSG